MVSTLNVDSIPLILRENINVNTAVPKGLQDEVVSQPQSGIRIFQLRAQSETVLNLKKWWIKSKQGAATLLVVEKCFF